jgi:aconitate hydratase
MTDSFKARSTLKSGAQSYDIWSLPALGADKVARLPYSLKILLENLLRFEDGTNVTRADIEALLNWDPKAPPSYEISFTPARVIMQDFTGVPAIVDLAAMREAMTRLGGDADEINPLAPAELVIDHSVQVDSYGTAHSLADNNRIEFERNVNPRFAISRWCRPTPGSCIRSILSTWAGWCSKTPRRVSARPTRIPWSAPIPTPP